MANDPVARLVQEALSLEHGPAKTALLEEAVRMVDVEGDIDRGYQLRQELLTAATFGGQIDLMLVHFSWCLSQFDRNPQHFNQFELLWKYKWVVANLASFPQLRREQIEEMLDDMERRYLAYGASLHAVYHKRRAVAVAMGDTEKAQAAHALFRRCERDWLSDCPACVADTMIGYLNFLGRNAQAIHHGERLLASTLECAEVPARTYARLLLPLLKAKRVEQAMEYHRRGYRLVMRNPGFLFSVTRHIQFMALTDNLAEAVKMIQKHYVVGSTCVDLSNRYEFYRIACLVMHCLQAHGKDHVRLRLPADDPSYREGGAYAVEELVGQFTKRARELAVRFDERNGNDRFQRKLLEVKKLRRWVIPYPLDRRRSGESNDE